MKSKSILQGVEIVEVNILAPGSSTSNNIYSFSEIIYLSHYLKEKGYKVSNFLLYKDELLSQKELLYNKDNVIILQWDGPEMIKWLDTYSLVDANRTIIFGITAQVYGDYILQDYPYINYVIKSFNYSCVHEALSNKKINIIDYSMEEISVPDITPLVQNLPIIPIVSSRGCPNRCSFCAVNCNKAINQNYKAKGVDYIINEIKEFMSKTKKSMFYFTDSCFVTKDGSSKDRAIEFAKRIIEQGLDIRYYIETRVDCVDYSVFELLKKSGLRRVLLGIENTHPNVLKRYNKNISTEQIIESIDILRALKINIDLTFILFDPFTKQHELLDNLNFILNSGLLEYTDLRGIFRRLILIPQNQILDTEQVLKYKENVTGLPDWIHKSYNYTIIDSDIQGIEDFICSEMNVWEEVIKYLCKDIKSIFAKRDLKITLSRLFVMAIKEILMLPNINMKPHEMTAIFRGYVSSSHLLKKYYEGDVLLCIENILLMK